MNLYDIGFEPWFEKHYTELNLTSCGLARITAVDRGAYFIRNESKELPAVVAGKLSYRTGRSIDLPCVGDWVAVNYYNDDTAAIIHHVLPRKTFLKRKAAGKTIDFQAIAANVDTAFLIQSCHYDFNPRRLDRYLIMAAEGGVESIIILTKTDLIPEEELTQKLATINSITSARVIALSNITGCGFDVLQQTLSPAKTYCLLGSSGVGKTTLINRLIGQNTFETRTVSNTGEGTHTTTRRQLIVLNQGALLIDTPGMRELGIVAASDGIDAGFEDVVELSAQCRYANCSHQHEPGCAVRAAIESNELQKDRYTNYIKLRKESDYHEMSYLEKRKKDKAFGRFLKSAKKDRKH